MRLWHKDLIKVLPRPQLISQWRECSAIVKRILKDGTPNHILVNYIMDYDLNNFISYSWYVRQEISRRGYRTMDKVWDGIVSLKSDYNLIDIKDVYAEVHNDEYYDICYWNLYEKYIRGGINEEDFEKIKR